MTTPEERRPGAADVDVRPLPLSSPTGPGAWHSVGTLPGEGATAITWELSDGQAPGVLYPGAVNTERRSVLFGIDLHDNGFTPEFEKVEPEAFTLTGFNTSKAGEARVFAGSLFGKTSPADLPGDVVGAELRIDPHEEFVFVVDRDFAHALLAVSGDLYLEDISLAPETIGFVKKGEKTLHIINADDDTAVALLLGANVD